MAITTAALSTRRWHRSLIIWVLLFAPLESFVASWQQQPVLLSKKSFHSIKNIIGSSSSSALGYKSSSSPFDTMVETSSSTKIQIRSNNQFLKRTQEEEHEDTHPNNNNDNSDLTLIPLSTEPLMFWSSKPLLTSEECQVLSQFFSSQQKSSSPAAKDSPRCYTNDDNNNKRIAMSLLQRVWQQIDQLTLSPAHAGESQLPNYLFYSPTDQDYDSTTTVTDSANTNSNNNNTTSTRWLFPNGLHVDTNNGKLFRHLTILLYLTTPHDDIIGGATNFPLAKPIRPEHLDEYDNHLYDDDDNNEEDDDLLQAAANAILKAKLHHTQFSTNQQMLSYGQKIEQAAVELFHAENHHHHHPKSSHLGLRVIPKAGHICVFSNLLDNGECDPRSFHGAEQLYSKKVPSSTSTSLIAPTTSTTSNHHHQSTAMKKEVLTFFKEIPLQQFTDHQQFARRVAQTRRRLQQRYTLLRQEQQQQQQHASHRKW